MFIEFQKKTKSLKIYNTFSQNILFELTTLRLFIMLDYNYFHFFLASSYTFFTHIHFSRYISEFRIKILCIFQLEQFFRSRKTSIVFKC